MCFEATRTCNSNGQDCNYEAERITGQCYTKIQWNIDCGILTKFVVPTSKPCDRHGEEEPLSEIIERKVKEERAKLDAAKKERVERQKLANEQARTGEADAARRREAETKLTNESQKWQRATEEWHAAKDKKSQKSTWENLLDAEQRVKDAARKVEEYKGPLVVSSSSGTVQ